MVYLIYGSPCSGKTTYVKEHFKAGDIVCDVDRLYAALCFNEEHKEELYAQEVAKELNKSLLDIVRDRIGHWKNAYVVSLANTPEKLQKAMERVNADQAIYIDTPYEVCMERAKERPFYFEFLIEEWFAENTIGEHDVQSYRREEQN